MLLFLISQYRADYRRRIRMLYFVTSQVTPRIMFRWLEIPKSTMYRLLGSSEERCHDEEEEDSQSQDFEKHINSDTRISLHQIVRSREFIILTTTLLAFNVFFVIAILLQTNRSHPAKVTEPFSADYVPSFEPITRTFEDTLSFGGRRTRFTDGNWDTLIPNGGGFIPFEHPESYGMPSDTHQASAHGSSNTSTPQVQLWGVSVFHQLHCLSMLRKIYWNDRDQKPMDEEFVQHAAHCFDFLRQAISCYSDTTLEMPQIRASQADDGKDEITRATHNSKRQCRDFESIKRWTEHEYKKALEKD